MSHPSGDAGAPRDRTSDPGDAHLDAILVDILRAQLRVAGYTRFEQHRPSRPYRVHYLNAEVSGAGHRFDGSGASVLEADREAVMAYRNWIRSARSRPRPS